MHLFSYDTCICLISKCLNFEKKLTEIYFGKKFNKNIDAFCLLKSA